MTIMINNCSRSFDRCAFASFKQILRRIRSQKIISKRKVKQPRKLKNAQPIRPLTNQENQNLNRAPLIFLKDRFKGPVLTINLKTGLRFEQVARKLGTNARKVKNQEHLGHNSKLSKMNPYKITPHTPRG